MSLWEFLSTDTFPGQTCALVVFLYLLCMYNKAINKTLD